MKCSCDIILKIPYGNPFRLGVCRSHVAPGNPDNITFADIDGLNVSLVRIADIVDVEHELTDGGDLMIIGEPTLECAPYRILMTGSYDGHPWRWMSRQAFSIVNSNNDSNVQGMETFGVETYWLDDILVATITDNDTGGQTLSMVTHGKVKIDSGTIKIMSDGVSLDDGNETLKIKNEKEIWQ